MAYPQHVWRQLKNLTSKQLIDALKADGWQEDVTRGATRAFVKDPPSNRRAVIHHHPGKTYGPRLLRELLGVIGWSEEDFRRLGLIK